MRLKKLWKWLLLAGVAALIVQNRRRVASRLTRGVRRRLDRDDGAEQDVDIWPGSREIGEESLQAIDEAGGFQIEAFSDEDLEVTAEFESIGPSVAPEDAGELYGAHVVPAENTDLPDNDASFDEGENWLEALEHVAAEDGPVPERKLDMIDTQDQPPHPTDHRDIPVADRGAAGPRGL